ncbi:MAG: VWA domain-containing protein [Chloroflexi bacterium]|nr:VWA domain-containing protein [Chloroflexota bacterium]
MLHKPQRSVKTTSLWRAAALAALALMASIMLVSNAAAQEEGLTLNLTGLSADTPSEAQAVVTVLGSDGLPVPGLAVSDVQVQINDIFVPVTALDRGVDSSLPIAVVLALDVSGSMEGGALDEAKAAAGRFLEDLGPEDSVAVLTFNDTVNVAVPFTQDHAAATAIAGLNAEGATALYQATAESVRLAASTEHPYRAVILLSDGLDHGSVLSRDEAVATVEALAAPVFVIGLGDEIDGAYLEEVASLSGGRFAATPSPAGLAQLYEEAGELLRGQYILTLDTSQLALNLSEPANLRVHVKAAGLQASAERDVCAQQLCIVVRQTEIDVAVEGAGTYTADVISSEPVTSVTFLLDGEPVRKVSEPPYEFALDAAAVAVGGHELTARVETIGGGTESSAISFGAALSDGGGGSNVPLYGAGVAGAVVVAAIAFYLLRWRRPRGKERVLDPANLRPPGKSGIGPREGPIGPLSDQPPPAQTPAPADTAGRLHVTGGALSGQSFSVGTSPVSIGSGPGCLIRLESQGAGEQVIPSEFARVWIRDELLMVHEVRRLTPIGSEGGRWRKLAVGDVFIVGPYEIRFDIATTGDPPLDVPNVLRDPAPAESTAAGDAAAPDANGAGASKPEVVDENSKPVSQTGIPLRLLPREEVADENTKPASQTGIPLRLPPGEEPTV